MGQEKILIDYDRLREVIINLLSNAIKYTADDGQIEIEVVNQKEQVEVSVSDDGIGIPDDELPYIWERFHQVDRVRNPDSEGTGLGLAIVKEIIEGLGGEVKVESQEGVGSKFSFKINKRGPFGVVFYCLGNYVFLHTVDIFLLTLGSIL
ncbi:ATP-binding protein [Natroniella acetigena]|uniref:sensor histidine kinase n=1 Tax=Natroniella acetigena TaxID=52004 RepID=UPI00200B590C|nr:ATP-binding protein [Natroniella acetigena]MCK8828152.1 ATP-binding protein [Natroniella acetigena]